ncbi:amidohydrolase [Catalinimonas niigatensis]|uniref:amidohydrolase n=1 Tax=Catalinimonas niigatensis TaxID=1397264 RepID=UPI002665A20E|nr:amidohydrolase [Catalinimonas niigatensis]WPP52330.1 amidohydrolase [Catalinimonas niigatensis]
MKRLAFIVIVSLIGCTSPEQSADMVLLNGNIWTANPTQVNARAIAISADTIMDIGSQAKIRRYIGDSTQVIDLEGNFVTPGFIDSHVHFISGGFRLSSVQLRDAVTPEDFIQRIATFAQTLEPGTWITGGDWDHENWGGELPHREWIDSVTQNHPLWINRLDGHMALANTAAMKTAHVTKEIEEAAGGEIVRDEEGELTGIFKDNAMSWIEKAVPEPSDQQKDKALEAAMKYVTAQGVTSVHHMSGYMDVLERFRDEGKLITRIYAGMPIHQWKKLADKISEEGVGDKWLRIGSLKGFMDGSLGSHTAAFFDPFTDAPEDSGFFITTKEEMYGWVKKADSAGLQPMIHAIGDRAISELLDIYTEVVQENGARDRRFRIEHSQHIVPKDFGRYNSLGVIASMQPYHAIDDGRWAEKVIGPERIQTTYAFRSLLDEGVRLAFGSDWFVAPPTPLEGIYAAVTRRTLDGQNPEGWVPEQKISVEEALRAYTINAAFASFEENIKGTLEIGKLADMVVIDRDLFKINPSQIKEAKLLMTIIGGKIVYQSEEEL